jgi:preprotein translocase subunit SecF
MKKLALSIALFACSFSLIAQEKSLDKGTLESQFEYLVEKSARWEDFKVIKLKNIEKLKENVTDSIQENLMKISAAQEAILTHNQEIERLKEELDKAQMYLSKLQEEKDSISFLGMFLEKSTYKNLMYAVSAGLLVFMLFFLYRFRQSNSITAQIKETLNEIQEEFTSFKKRSLEKEQKLARELQNELNKRMG